MIRNAATLCFALWFTLCGYHSAVAIDIPGAQSWAERRLNEDAAAVRLEGVVASASLQRQARVAILQRGLQDNDSSVRLAALQLATYSPHLALESDIMALASSREQTVRLEAIRALGAIGSAASRQVLIAAAGHSDAAVREAVAQNLRHFELSAHAAVLLELLGDRDTDVVVATLQTIGETRFFPLAVEVLSAIDDRRQDVRDAAIGAAIQLPTPLVRRSLLARAQRSEEELERLQTLATSVAEGRWLRDALQHEGRVTSALPAALRYAYATLGALLDFDVQSAQDLEQARRQFAADYDELLAQGDVREASEVLGQWLLVGDPRATDAVVPFLTAYEDEVEETARIVLRALSSDEALVCEGIEATRVLAREDDDGQRFLGLALVNARAAGFDTCANLAVLTNEVDPETAASLFTFWRHEDPEAALHVALRILTERAPGDPLRAQAIALFEEAGGASLSLLSTSFDALAGDARRVVAELVAASGTTLDVVGDDAAALLARFGAAPAEAKASLLDALRSPRANVRTTAALLLSDVCGSDVHRALERAEFADAASTQERRCGEAPRGILEELRVDLSGEGSPLGAALHELGVRDASPRREDEHTGDAARRELLRGLSSPHRLVRYLRVARWGERYGGGDADDELQELALSLAQDPAERSLLAGRSNGGPTPGSLIIVGRSDGAAATGRRIFVRYQDGFEEIIQTDAMGRARLSSRRQPLFFALIDDHE